MSEQGDKNQLSSFATEDEKIVQEAKKRFDRCAEWESTARSRFVDDIRFTWGDSDNGFQWPDAISGARNLSERPCLTMNLVNQHCKMISNEARKNKASVRYVGMGNGATQSAAQIYGDLQKHIEYQSQAQIAYTIARDFAVSGGIGWFRLITKYEGTDTFDQDFFITPINDPLSVYMDPDIQYRNGSDAMHAFVFDDLTKEEFDLAYPDFKNIVGKQPLGAGSLAEKWVKNDSVRVCEYFRKVPKVHKLVSVSHMGERHTVKHENLSKLIKDASVRNALLADPQTKIRDVVEHEVEWYLIAGEKIIDRTIWVGKYIPLFRVIGDETVIEGQLDRKGHTRWMKDAQRMFNYNASGQVEFVGLQSRTPWLAPIKAIEEFEEIWATANTKNHGVLPYHHVDPEGDPAVPIPPPARINPPMGSPAYQEGMETAKQQLYLVSGQGQNQMGEVGNERTGAAINARQQQSDTAVFHFQDNYEMALIFLGQQLLDGIPKLYDTKRVKRIIADDGIEYDLEIDPSLRQGYLEHQAEDGKAIKKVLNPNVGRFEVAATVGPAIGTRREEIVNSLTLILTQAPALTNILGDILVKNMDFPDSQEAAMRLRRLVPPQALGDGPTPNEQHLQQQLNTLQSMLTKALDKHAKDGIKLEGKEELRDIETYNAETKRMAALQQALPLDQDGLKQLVAQLVQDAMGGSGGGDASAPAQAPQAQAPVPGATKAPDGEWYIADPSRPGQHIHIQSEGASNVGQ